MQCIVLRRSYYQDYFSDFHTHFRFLTAVALAIFRDGGSGGCIRIGIITKDGIERRVVLGNEIPQFYQGV